MALTHDTRPPRSGADRAVHRSLVPPALAGTWSALAALLGLWWWATGGYPFGPTDPQSRATALALLPAEVGLPLLIGLGAVGVLVAALAAVRTHRATAGRSSGKAGAALVIVTGGLHGIALLLLAPGASLLVLTAYVVAVLGPLVLLAAMLAGARRSRPAAAVAAALLLVGVLAWASGVAAGGVLGTWAVELAGGLAAQGPRMLLLLFLAAGGAAWVVLAWGAARDAAGGRAPAWTRPAAAARWGRVATVVAASCALPYVLVRATWLTPWPVGLPDGPDADLVAAVLLQGLLLGGAVLGGAVLTTGLVARWGEVWPRWVPRLRGRPVPVAAAVVPATVVSVLLCAAAVSLVAMAVRDGDPSTLLLFPMPVWGPALGVAALGYALRRRGERPGPVDGA